MRTIRDITGALAIGLLSAASSPSFALNFAFTFTNTIGNTAGTVTGVVYGLKDNTTTAATDVIITSYPSVMTGMPPAPFSLMTGSKYISRSMNSFPVYNGQVQTDGNLGHGLFEFDSMAMYDYSWDFCISGIGFATSPCMPPSWLSSENLNWTNIRHVMTNDIAQFTPIAASAVPYKCEGFQNPFDTQLVLDARNHRSIPLKAQVLNSAGPVGPEWIAPPIVEVELLSADALQAAAQVPAQKPSRGDSFRFDPYTATWMLNLSTAEYATSGTYRVMLRSGDPDNYLVLPCVGTFVRQ
jgi:hypothetical protein